MKKFLEDFKKFALKGNMIDLAVGMIIGSAFTSIVSSLVNDIFMPVLSIFTGKIDFSNMFIALDGNKYPTLAAANEVTATINYGAFTQAEPAAIRASSKPAERLPSFSCPNASL